jgi:hypothetical protein
MRLAACLGKVLNDFFIMKGNHFIQKEIETGTTSADLF